jgi:AcrR family transcriptional regulator
MDDKPMKTKDRILITALDLFNENGTVKITTNHIADAMGISPGNLYYHYRNKEEIIRTLWEIMVHRIKVPFSDTTGLDHAREIIHFLYDFFGIMYDYRFFWLEIAVLIEKDALLKELYTTRSRLLMDRYKRTVRRSRDNGFFRPSLTEEDLDQLIENTWFLSQYWALHTLIHEGLLNRDNLRKGAMRIITTFKPYLNDQALSALKSALKATSQKQPGNRTRHACRKSASDNGPETQ